MNDLRKLFDPGSSVVLEASAGTGKTWRLVRRYLATIGTNDPNTGEPWAGPEEVIAVTFTRAAAAEMRDRVVAALCIEPENISEDDQVLEDVLAQCPEQKRREIAARIPAAPIGTIHRLCAALLAEFPELSGVAPDARAIEPGEDAVGAARFVGRFLDSILDEESHRRHQDLKAVLLEVPLSAVKQELSAMADQYEELPEDLESPEAVARARNAFALAQYRPVVEEMAPLVAEVRGALEKILAVNAENPGKDKSTPALVRKRDLLSDLRGLFEAGDVARLVEAVGRLSGVTQNGLQSRKVDKPVKEAIRALKAGLGSIGQIRGIKAWPRQVADPAHDERIARYVRLGRAARREYKEHLRSRGLLRYDDLESRALELLAHPTAREYLHRRYKYLLVDELQDTNQRQVDLLDALAEACGGLVTFYVGDPKQSIYRFRGADVEVFRRQIGLAEKRHGNLSLPQTRRPSPELNRFFNCFFGRVLPGGARLGPDDLRGEPDRAAVPWDARGTETIREQADLPGKPVDLVIRCGGGADRDPDAPLDVDDEADRVAVQLLGVEADADADENTPDLAWNEVAVLLPKWKSAERFRAALEARGIPAQVAGGRGLLSLPEVRDLVNLVRLLADPDDDLAALGVLRGPCFGMSDLGLYATARWPGLERLDDRGGQNPWEEGTDAGQLPYCRSPLSMVMRRGVLLPEEVVGSMTAAGVLDRADRGDRTARLERDAAALDAGRDLLEALLERAGSCPTADLLAEAIVDLRLEACWLASPRGRRAVTNAWRFVELVRGLEADGPNPGDVCAWIDAAGAGATPEGLIEAESAAVTITTVHGAKGREWKLVVLGAIEETLGGGVAESSWKLDRVPTLIETEELVPRIKVPGGGFSTSSDPLNDACKVMLAPAEAAETKRLLYVGMTRARDRLVISGSVRASHGRDKHGTINPLRECHRTADYIVAGLELTEVASGSPVLGPPADSRCRAWLNVVDDERLTELAAGLEAPDVKEAEAIPVREEALAWTATGRIRTHTPSSQRSVPGHWKPDEIVWSVLEPCAAAVEVPEPPSSFHATLTGDLFHEMMERWSFDGDPPDETECARVAELHLPGRGAEHGGWMAACARSLADSDTGSELLDAAGRGELFHEVPVDAIVDGADRITGRIDLLFKGGDGKWNVIDYKVSDKFHTAQDVDEVKRTYLGQLLIYRKALEQWAPDRVGRVGLWLAPAGEALWLE